MDIRTEDSKAQRAADQTRPIDPLHRVLIPVEKQKANGTTVFQTSDKQQYVRQTDGSIRRATLKVNGTEARRARARARAEKSR